MMLFAALPLPDGWTEHLPRRYRIGAPWWVAVRALAQRLRAQVAPPPAPVQVEIRAPLRELDRDDLPDAPLVHRVVSAADAPPVKTLGVASVFALAGSLQSLGRCRATEDVAAPAPYRVEREAGRIRVVRLRPEETEEWQERERARRARQKPPRPVAKAKTRGKKVRGWDGEAVE